MQQPGFCNGARGVRRELLRQVQPTPGLPGDKFLSAASHLHGYRYAPKPIQQPDIIQERCYLQFPFGDDVKRPALSLGELPGDGQLPVHVGSGKLG